MKKVSINLPRQLDLGIRTKLVNGRYRGHDPEELFYLQRFPKARIQPTGYTHNKVVELCSTTPMQLAYGYRVFRYKGEKRWNKEPFSFALEKGRVVEIDKNFTWDNVEVHYVGVIVEPELYKDLDYIKQAGKTFYKERSPFALYEIDFKGDPNDEDDRKVGRK